MRSKLAMGVLATMAVAAAPAQAKKIDVHPGHDAITKAIARASSGDTLRIHPGTYHEAPAIDKPIKLVGVGKHRPKIDAGCKVNDAIHVISGGVTLDHLVVTGAAQGFGDYPAEVFFEGTRTGVVRGVRAIGRCGAEYGISLFSTGAAKVVGDFARGFSDSGIYIGTITDTNHHTLLAAHNRMIGNARGIIVEDSNLPSVAIRIANNVVSGNRLDNDEGLPSDGLFLTNSDHVDVVSNIADGNHGSGFHPNSSSDDNAFDDNVARNNDGGAFLDEGTGNCGAGNSFPIPAC